MRKGIRFGSTGTFYLYRRLPLYLTSITPTPQYLALSQILLPSTDFVYIPQLNHARQPRISPPQPKPPATRHLSFGIYLPTLYKQPLSLNKFLLVSLPTPNIYLQPQGTIPLILSFILSHLNIWLITTKSVQRRPLYPARNSLTRHSDTHNFINHGDAFKKQNQFQDVRGEHSPARCCPCHQPVQARLCW